MRYLKALLIVILLFFGITFFFQNQMSLSQDVVLTINLFFIPPMSSIPLPFYFIILSAFFVGALLTMSLLAWDKFCNSAKMLKTKLYIGKLERELEKYRKANALDAKGPETQPEKKKNQEEEIAPNPDVAS